MSGTFPNWPAIVDRALRAERLPPLPSTTANAASQARARVPRAVTETIWDEVDALPHARPFGITMARVVDYADLEEIGIALATATSVRDIGDLLVSYHRLISDGIAIEAETTRLTVDLSFTDRGAVHWRAHEFAAAITVRLLRARFGASSRPLSAQLAVPRRHPATAYEHYFRCPVTLEGPATVLRLPVHLRTSGEPAPRITRGLSTVLDDALTRLSGGTVSATRDELLRRLPTGDVTVRQIAGALHMSERTLQRQLAAEGTTFRALRQEVIEALALRWIRDDGVPIKEVAHRLGFASTSAFARAFRRWHGVAPRDAQRSQRHR